MSRLDLSLVIPLFNEEESLGELYAWIERVCAGHGLKYEVLFINDGSTDGSWAVIQGLAARHPEVRGIRFRRNHGKSAALFVGFQAIFFRSARTGGWIGAFDNGVTPHPIFAAATHS